MLKTFQLVLSIYRLRQIDYDGTIEYSNEVEVEITTSIEIALYQSYTNPFNPNTLISYQLPVSSIVTLKGYDVLGKEVVTLVNEEKETENLLLFQVQREIICKILNLKSLSEL